MVLLPIGGVGCVGNRKILRCCHILVPYGARKHQARSDRRSRARRRCSWDSYPDACSGVCTTTTAKGTSSKAPVVRPSRFAPPLLSALIWRRTCTEIRLTCACYYAS